MECYYHPDRDGTDNCAICGKSICKECGLEIAGKIYCKECLEKIVGLSISNNAEQARAPVQAQEPLETEPVELAAQTTEDSLYQPQEENIDFEIPYAQEEATAGSKVISDDSPYNIKDNIEYSGGLESSYLEDVGELYQKPNEPQVAQNEFNSPEPQVLTKEVSEADFIYPDHSYEPQPTSARQELEDKYEKYLDDLYFDEGDVPLGEQLAKDDINVPLGEQLAKDEAQYGSLTRKQYSPRVEEPVEQQPPSKKVLKEEIPKQETPEEMEARIRAEILKEQGLMTGDAEPDVEEDGNIHNLNYKDEKEPMGVLDILLSIILIIVVLVVLYYIVYLFLLSTTYPTFMDALFALKNPQNVINAVLTH